MKIQQWLFKLLKKTKRYGQTDTRTHGLRENSIPHLLKKKNIVYGRTTWKQYTPPQTKFAGGYNKCICTIMKLGHIV